MAYLSKNIAFSWNKIQLLIAETYGYQKWYHDVLLRLHSGALWRDRGGGGQESLCSWKWKHLNNGLSEGPQMLGSRARTPACSRRPHLRLQFWKCRRWVEVPGMLEKGRWANRWTVNWEWKAEGQRTRARVTGNLGQKKNCWARYADDRHRGKSVRCGATKVAGQISRSGSIDTSTCPFFFLHHIFLVTPSLNW